MTDEGTACRSLKGKMLLHAKHMGLLENMRTAKDRLFQMGVQGRDKHITQPIPKKHLPTRQPLHKPKNGKQLAIGSLIHSGVVEGFLDSYH